MKTVLLIVAAMIAVAVIAFVAFVALMCYAFKDVNDEDIPWWEQE